MATIKDVAALAGVSTATVSRVINGTKVADDMERAVRAAADQLSYIPSRTARTLRLQNSQVIALVIPDIENPFWTSVARGVEDRARAAGYSIMLCNTDEDPVRESTYVEIALAEHISGVILVPSREDRALKLLIQQGCPVVAVDRRSKNAEVDLAVFDSERGARQLVRALIENGYSRIACISGRRSVETSVLRAKGWRDAAVGRGAEHDGYLLFADGQIEGGRIAMLQLLDLRDPPDAVFIANNLMAVGAIEALESRGLEPPTTGIAVLGDLPYGVFRAARAFVADLPARELGSAAAELLISRIAGANNAPRTITLASGPVMAPASA